MGVLMMGIGIERRDQIVFGSERVDPVGVRRSVFVVVG